jgi:hypothetical protein
LNNIQIKLFNKEQQQILLHAHTNASVSYTITNYEEIASLPHTPVNIKTLTIPDGDLFYGKLSLESNATKIKSIDHIIIHSPDNEYSL